jgi:hypothetical protein
MVLTLKKRIAGVLARERGVVPGWAKTAIGA